MRRGFSLATRTPWHCTIYWILRVRALRRDGSRCGGRGAAIFYRNLHLKGSPDTVLRLKAIAFEILVVKLIVGVERFFIIDMYRVPKSDIAAFFEELSDVVVD